MMMLLKPREATQVLLIRPGSTEFDEQGRMKGSLDIPLSKIGKQQAEEVACELGRLRFTTIFASPCRSAQQTAKKLAAGRDVKVRTIDAFRNVDHGLWSGKLIDEVRRNQPRIYKCGQDSPEEVCPPQGEAIRDAQSRVSKAVRKLVKRSGQGIVAMVIPDPLASMVEAELCGETLPSLWTKETDHATWTMIESLS